MLFDSQHILYMVISGVITAAIFVLCSLFLKDERKKEWVLKISALATVAIHYSDLWVDYFSTQGQSYISNTHILLMYPCNVMMWFLFIAAFIKDKTSIGFAIVADFVFYVGVICSVLGIVLNINYANNPNLADYSILKGMVSHSTMLIGCLYMIIGKYVKIGPQNAINVTLGLLSFVICGVFENWIFDVFGMTSPDGMFIKSNPYIPVSPIILGIPVVFIMFGILLLCDLRHKKEDRWLSQVKNFFAGLKK